MYEIIKELKEKDLFSKCLQTGLISVSFSRYYDIYEFYIAEIKTTTKMTALVNTSEKFNVGERSVYNIIGRMS
tara:strand:- start:78 stop:296 length:219 start_codon:yes stop_codon:yes gene_type:complete